MGRRSQMSPGRESGLAGEGRAKASAVLLVHGAGSGPWVFDGWLDAFGDLAVEAVDLQEGLDVSSASMRDYAANVERRVAGLPQPVALCGWSMGGLVVLQVAGHVTPHSVVVIEPSPPGEVQGFAPAASPREGLFDPEAVYGRFPTGVRARPESQLARAERKRGISVPMLPCPSLVVYGNEFADVRGKRVAALYRSREAFFPGLDHWQLVLSSDVRRTVADFLAVD